jgi:hypothetical protein
MFCLDIILFNSNSGGWSSTGSSRHVGHQLAYCTCPGCLWGFSGGCKLNVRMSDVYMFHSVCKVMLSSGLVLTFYCDICLCRQYNCSVGRIGQKCINVKENCEVSVCRLIILPRGACKMTGGGCHSVTWWELNQSVSVNLYYFYCKPSLAASTV